ncbi:MAG: cellulose biosynthesis cyclic di-GMP-binding regulatory protein BcsB [Aliihoeflea sp.]|uniref:cellulose biosynthesis cyclic di-GMP-binding regulatory protein BcsB n=1 Tax=Aliihoeflea sp. TaxID=2608088 RepID=UPI004034BCDB
MKRELAAALMLLAPGAALAQGTPFDMSPERPAAEEQVPAIEAPQPLPAPQPESAPVPEATDEPAPEAETTDDPVPEAEMADDPADASVRHLLPLARMRLNGESDSRAWAVYLTGDQAQSAARLDLAYSNAIVVAPETSRLFVSVNGISILDQSIQSAETLSHLSLDVAPGVLQPGRNEISVRAVHRHRTDCSIASTYELWTELDGAGTTLTFTGDAAVGPESIEELRALGANIDGEAQIAIVAPSLSRSDIGADLLRLAQAVTLSTSLANSRFSIAASMDEASQDAALVVVVGTAEEVAALAEVDSGEIDGASASLHTPAGGVPTLLVTGRSRQEWLAAIDGIAQQVDRPANSPREFLVTEAVRTPNAPMLYEARSVSFAEFGIASEQFAGRRYARSFQFAIPSDFYAGSYGQARILLDAAYTSAVLPGGLINVYVNGNIATSVPMTARRGAVLRQFPIKVTMEHFRPGVNTVLLEVDLLTEADQVCAPGATTDETPRFAVFDTSRFVLPQFARVGQFPNLAAVAGTGFPYNRAEEPVPVLIGRGSTAGLSAAANFLANLAQVGGRIVPVQLVMSPEAAREQNALFFGTPASVPANVLTQVGIDAQAASSWAPIRATGSVAASAGTAGANPVTMEDWRTRMDTGRVSQAIDATRNWLSETFDLTADMLRFAPRDDPPYTPAQTDALVVAQGLNPAGTGTWTVVAAADDVGLEAGGRALASAANWSQIAGHIAAFPAEAGPPLVLDAGSVAFVASQEPSLGNYRLIVANWLSSNILSYALGLVVICIVLGVSTSRLLARLGRRN